MKKTVGVLTALALMTAGPALAGGDQVHPRSDVQQGASGSPASDGYGGSGSAGTSGASVGSGAAAGGTTTGSSGTSAGQMGSSGTDQAMGGSGSTGSATMGSGTQQTAQGTQQLTGTVVRADRKVIYLDHMGAIVPLKVDKQTQFTGNVKRAQDIKEGQQVRASYAIEGKVDNVAKSIDVSASTGTGGAGTLQNGQGGSGLEGSPINDLPSGAGADPTATEPIDPTLDTDLSNPATTPATGESRGPASPLPGEGASDLP